MTSEVVAWLASAAGQECLAEAAQLQPTLTRFPACLDRLKKRYPSEAARAALDLILLRPKAARKFTHFTRMIFDREGLEMATGERIARYRAERFHTFATAADLCSGIGGDALELARVVPTLHVVDRDPARLAMTTVNLAAQGLTAHCHCVDALNAPLDGVEAVFADPNRRDGARRHLNPAKYQPAVPELIRQARSFNIQLLGIKIAPGVAESDWRSFQTETEFISDEGELKEAVLWFGKGCTSHPRATILPGPHQLQGEPVDCPTGPLAEWIYDPDPAVVRAKQLGRLAFMLNSHRLDSLNTIMTASDKALSPFATCFRLTEAMPYHPRRVRDWLQAHDTGRVTLLERGSGLDIPKLEKLWNFTGHHDRVVILTKVHGVVSALICEPSAG